MARGPKLAEIIAISSQWTFLGELVVRASGSTTGRKRAWVMDMVTPQGGGGWEGVDVPKVHASVRCPQFSCAIVHCTLCTSIHNCASPSVTGISARGQSAGPWGSNYPPWLRDRCSLGAGLTRLAAQTNLVKDREPSNDARWLCR